MNKTDELFLNALKLAIRNKKMNIEEDLSDAEWRQFFHLASIHDVLPLIINSVYQSKALQAHASIRDYMIRRGRRLALYQAQRSGDFILLYQKMNEEGIKPLIMKGIICRNLYETPELRPSADEDMLIFPWQIQKYHDFFMNNGFRLLDEDMDIEKEDEVSYLNPENHLYIEVHKYLFPTDDKAYGSLNSLFSVLEDRVTETIYHVPIRTFGYTDHLIYMICHAYKHLLYSGIGIRQLCDIGLFAEKLSDSIDWERVFTSCEIFRMKDFFGAILKICSKYLGIQLKAESFVKYLDLTSIDELPLLEDILSGGLYGVADEDRLHSSTMTLEVVSAQREGRKSRGLISSIFPERSYMETKFPYLKQKKWMLPIAYIQRTKQYLSKSSKNRVSPGKTIAIGNSRIRLLKKYNIID